jgi:tRNA(Ile)-lysidine synthase
VTEREAVDAVRRAVRLCVADLTADALVVVACSGGPDSTALAAALAHQGPRLHLRVGALIVDHQLQAGSAQVAANTAEWLQTQGFEFVEIAAVTPAAFAGGPESAARSARYAAFDDLVALTGAAAVLLGHTRDDQAETVLLGLARGSGARSLSGMAPVRGHFRRPMLELSRETVHAAVPPEAPVVHDPHNQDPSYARSRTRSTVLPMLEAELGPGVSVALARSARLLRDDADALEEWAERVYLEEPEAAAQGFDLVTLQNLPAAIRSRVLRRAALAAGSPAGSLTADHVAALDRLVVAWRGQGMPALPGGVLARRACGRLHLQRLDHPG